MQGEFPRPRAAPALGRDWGDLLQREAQSLPDPDAAAAAAPAPGPAAATIRVQPAPLRFILGERVFFVRRGVDEPAQEAAVPQWLVPHVQKPVHNLAGAPVPGSPRYRPYVDGDTPVRDDAAAGALKPALDAMQDKGDPYVLQPGRHVQMPDPGRVFTIGEGRLRYVGERAENLDYKFALRMQGLQNATLKAVWVCSDPDLGGDRRDDLAKAFSELFIRDFLSFKTLNPTGNEGGPRVDAALREAVHLFNEMTSAWVDSHRHGLSPQIMASAESLVGLFFRTGLRQFADRGYTWGEVARFLMRDPRFAPHFGLCLHYYMTKMEQDRGGRNASYKAMFNAAAGNLMALNAMNAFLTQNREQLDAVANQSGDEMQRMFHISFVDWYGVVVQLHPQRKLYAYTRGFPD